MNFSSLHFLKSEEILWIQSERNEKAINIGQVVVEFRKIHQLITFPL